MGASTESSTLNDGNVSLSNIDVANNENKYFKQQIKALQSEMEAMQLFIKRTTTCNEKMYYRKQH